MHNYLPYEFLGENMCVQLMFICWLNFCMYIYGPYLFKNKLQIFTF